MNAARTADTLRAVTRRAAPRISGPYRRDPNTNIVDTSRWNHDTYAAYANDNWLWTEMVAGVVSRVLWDGLKATPMQARTKQLPDPETCALIAADVDPAGLHNTYGDTPTLLFGVTYAKPYTATASWALIDIHSAGAWADRDTLPDIGDDLGCEHAPIVGETRLGDAVDDIRAGRVPSLLALTRTPIAGMVGVPVDPARQRDKKGRRVIVKLTASNVGTPIQALAHTAGLIAA